MTISVSLLLAFVMTGCAEMQPSQPVQPEATVQQLESKADAVWSDTDEVTLDWSEVLHCAVALSEGAWSGAASLVDRLWHLPGAIARLIGSLGRELLRREADLLASYTDAEALERVRATREADLKALRGLLLSIRRVIPELWVSFKSGSGWFQTLERDQKIQLVCEVTGRMTFEIIAIILTDKGFTRLVGLTRLRLVEGVTSKVLDFVRYARLSHVGLETIEDVGSRIAGETDRRWSDPAALLGSLGELADYVDGACPSFGSISCPSAVTYDAGRWLVHTHQSQWERLKGSGYLDAVLPANTALPSGAIVVETIPEDLISVLLHTDPVYSAIDTTNLGTLFRGDAVRVFLPGDTSFTVPNSELYVNIQERIADLEIHLETSLESALRMTADFWNRSPIERLTYLDALVEEAASLQDSESAPVDTLDYQ